MSVKKIIYSSFLILILFSSGCNPGQKKSSLNPQDSLMLAKIKSFAVVKLSPDLRNLSAREKQMIPLLIDAARIMDELYWRQTLGDKKTFLDTIKDTLVRKFAEINYGPWERLNANKPFVNGFGDKPSGANFYPKDLSKDEFNGWKDANKNNQYTLIVRNDNRSLKSVWYHEAFKAETEKAAALLNEASTLADDPGLKKYLELRAKALLTDDYYASDMAWMEMKNNTIELVIGPIENYEDQLYGTRTSYECFVLAKDREWSKKLEKFAAFLPELQASLPVDPKYKKEKPGTDSDLNAYDLIYVSGQSNSGSKTIAINLPNDEKVQLKKGSRRLQLKNAMKAKFDNILLPISNMLIDSAQQGNIKFDAFFSNIMFHEVAHGLGIRNTVNGKGNVREALKEQYSSFEEAKADILGLYMATSLILKGEIKDLKVADCYVTYMAGLIRSVRFGAASAHGKANMMCLNFFEDQGAFGRSAGGKYTVNFDKMKSAVNQWAEKILMFEGDGNYEGAKTYLAENGKIRDVLASDLLKLSSASIPVDIVYEQGPDLLNLK